MQHRWMPVSWSSQRQPGESEVVLVVVDEVCKVKLCEVGEVHVDEGGEEGVVVLEETKRKGR
jgi:hypothetical protein